MESLAFIHSAIAYEDPGALPEVRPLESMLPKIPGPVAVGLASAAIASGVLLGAGAAQAEVYRPGDRGDNVEKIQQALGIPVDGVYGSQTQEAIKNFQRRRGLPVDGVAGSQTLEALGLGYLDNVGGPTEIEFAQEDPFVTVPSSPMRQYSSGSSSASSESFRTSQAVGVGSRQTAVIRTSSGIGVNVRDRPNGVPVGGIDDGTRVTLTGRTEFAGGFNWAELTGGGWVATDFLVYDSGPGPGPGPGPGRGRFVVVVPGSASELLWRVQRFVPGATRDISRLGPFINAGEFVNRSAAERLSDDLRDRGLDARVSYRGIR